MATSIIVQLKKRKDCPEQGTITIRGYFNRKPAASITTGQKIKTKDWDPVKREVVQNAPNATMINMVIQSKLLEMKKQLLKKEIMGATINRQHVIKAVRNIDEGVDFCKFCRERIKEYNNKETRRTYTSEVTKLEQFQPQISFPDIDYSFLVKYKAYMEQKLSNTDNTVWKSFKFMNTMMNTAMKMKGIIETNPFEDFNRGKYIQTRRNFLEIADCDQIQKLIDHENDMIRKVAVYFLLMAYSGMRFSDAMRFDPALHVIDNQRIVMQYQKWKGEVNNKMFTRLKEIVQLVPANRLKIGNKQFNIWLKVIAGICQIPINLSAHVGRHTMGGILAELEVPEEQAKIILGQKDIRSTRIYYHIKNKNIDAAMDKLNAI